MRIQLDYSNGHSLTSAATAGTLGGSGASADQISFNSVAGIADATDLSVLESAPSGGGSSGSGAPDFDALLSSIGVTNAGWNLDAQAASLDTYAASKSLPIETNPPVDSDSDGTTDFQYNFVKNALESMYYDGVQFSLNANQDVVTLASHDWTLELGANGQTDTGLAFTTTSNAVTGQQEITGTVKHLSLASSDNVVLVNSKSSTNVSVDLGTLLPLTEGGHNQLCILQMTLLTLGLCLTHLELRIGIQQKSLQKHLT